MSLYLQLCLQGFFFWLAYDLSRFPVIPLYAQKLGLPPEAIGLAVAASTLTGIVGKSIAGGLSDSIGRKILMITACLVVTLLPCLYFLADDASSLVTLRLFHGFGTAIMGPVGRAFASDIIPANRRGNLLSTYMATTNLGTLAARSLGGFLLFWGGFFFPFAASAVAGVIALGLAFRWTADRQRKGALGPLFQQLKEGFRQVGTHRTVLVTSVVEAAQYFALGAVDAFLPIYAQEKAGLTDWQIGLLYGVQMGMILISKPFMGWVSDQVGRRPQIVIGLLAGGLFVWRIPWEVSFMMLTTLAALFGITVGVTTSATTALVTDVCERRHYGAAHGVFGTILDIGHAAGPILTGFLIARWSYRPGFTVVSLLLILASLCFAFLVRPKTDS